MSRLKDYNEPAIPFEGLASTICGMFREHPADLLRGTKLFVEDLRAPHTLISARSLETLLENSCRLWDGPGFPFELGKLASAHGLIHPLVWQLQHPTRRGQFISLHSAYGATTKRAWLETAAVLTTSRATESAPVHYFFPFSEPAHFAYYDVFVRARCTFDAPLAGMLVSNQPPDPTTYKEGQAFIGRLRSALHANPQQGRSVTAKQFNMSLASFKRRLTRHGVSFQALLDDVQRTHAMVRLMVDGDPVERIRDELGYADNRSFRRSFQRWTGRTPVEFQAEWTLSLA